MRLVDATARQRGFGDYYGYALVAEGKAEIYVEVDLKPWDVAADEDPRGGGGRAAHRLRGRSTSTTGRFVASNGCLHEDALRLLAAIVRAMTRPTDAAGSRARWDLDAARALPRAPASRPFAARRGGPAL